MARFLKDRFLRNRQISFKHTNCFQLAILQQQNIVFLMGSRRPLFSTTHMRRVRQENDQYDVEGLCKKFPERPGGARGQW